ncbi:MAG: hypothetical protein ABIV47_00750 [Roseiflexaceae bacterium]
MKTYRISSSGRRTALILLAGALIIWIFALWTFGSTLGINPVAFWSTLRVSIEQGLSISQLVPALLMLVLIVATPLVIWNICEELAAAYTPGADGLRFTALGIRLLVPWAGIRAIRRVDEDSDEPMDELLLREDYTSQIGNPLLRFLHAQAYGRTKLPIYAGVADRDELLTTIQQQAELVETEAPSVESTDPAPAT